MIKVLYQLNNLGYGGTEKSILTFIENLDKNKFEPYLYLNSDINSLKFWIVKLLAHFSERYSLKYNEKYIRNFVRVDQFKDALNQRLIIGRGMQGLINAISKINPDIIHFNRGIEEDFYTKSISKIDDRHVLIETNIFGESSNAEYLDRLKKVIFSSHWLCSRANWAVGPKKEVLYLPVKDFKVSEKKREKTRHTLQIPKDAIVVGRLSRPNLDDGDFILQVFEEILLCKPSIIFITIGSTEEFQFKTAKSTSIINLPPSVDEDALASFFSAIDVFMHYRVEGETFGLNIAEAMTAGLPIVTHISSRDNAQVELVTKYRTCGIVIENLSAAGYARALIQLFDDTAQRRTLSENSRANSRELFSPISLTRKLESIYESALK